MGTAAATKSLELFTLEGRLLRSVTVAPGEERKTLAVGDLPAGFYVLVGTGDVNWRQRIIVR